MLIPTNKNVKTITDMRENALDLLKQIEKSEDPIYLFHHSKPKAVLLSLEEYIKLQEILEDYLEEKEAKKLAKTPREKLIPFEKVAQKYTT